MPVAIVRQKAVWKVQVVPVQFRTHIQTIMSSLEARDAEFSDQMPAWAAADVPLNNNDLNIFPIHSIGA